MTRITIDADFEPLRRMLANFLRRAEYLVEPFDEIGQYLISEFTENIENGRSPDGDNWGQNNPSRRAIEQSGKTLIDTGHLRDSTTHSVTAQALEVGTNLSYAAIHQFGGQGSRGFVPARPWMGWNQEYMDFTADIILDYITGRA